MRLLLPTTLLASIFCAAPGAPPTPPAPAPQAGHPTLLVFITVDQMRGDYLDRWSGQLTAGLKRLREGGAFFTNAHQDHAITETAPGHASLMSGRFPRSTGITRNLAGVADRSTPLIGSTAEGASPARFRGTTLTDWMVAAHPATKVLSISSKDRGAILPIGRSKQQVYWVPFTGPVAVTTSSWYRDTLPDWVSAFNARNIPGKTAGRVWELLLPASNYPEPDSVAVESGGRNVVFPHPNSPDTVAASQLFRNFPWLDEYLAAFALEGVERLGLGRGNDTDLLAVSFSTTDYIGHRYGPDSRELHDQILRLDRTIGAFIDSLYKLRDSTRIIFALAADHGVTPFPEVSHPEIKPAPLRVRLTPALEAAVAVLRAAKADTGAVDFESGALFVQRVEGITPALVNAVADSFVAAARRIPGVARSERFASLGTRDFAKDPVARRWVHMFPPDLAPEAIVSFTPGSYYASATIAMHGQPSDWDSHVPIVFYGAPFKPGRYDAFTRTVDIAPTLAQVLGVTPTEPLDGVVLKAAIR